MPLLDAESGGQDSLRGRSLAFEKAASVSQCAVLFSKQSLFSNICWKGSKILGDLLPSRRPCLLDTGLLQRLQCGGKERAGAGDLGNTIAELDPALIARPLFRMVCAIVASLEQRLEKSGRFQQIRKRLVAQKPGVAGEPILPP